MPKKQVHATARCHPKDKADNRGVLSRRSLQSKDGSRRRRRIFQWDHGFTRGDPYTSCPKYVPIQIHDKGVYLLFEIRKNKKHQKKTSKIIIKNNIKK